MSHHHGSFCANSVSRSKTIISSLLLVFICLSVHSSALLSTHRPTNTINQFSSSTTRSKSSNNNGSPSSEAAVTSSSSPLLAMADQQTEEVTNNINEKMPSWKIYRTTGFSASPFDDPALQKGTSAEDVKGSNIDNKWDKAQYEQSLHFYNQLNNCDDAYVAPQIKEALQCLSSAYHLYGPECIVGSFNGGKDAVVIMHLMRAAHAKYYHDQIAKQQISNGPYPNIVRPRAIYFESNDEYPEIQHLVRTTVSDYNLEMLSFDSKFSFWDALKILVDGHQPRQMAFVLGTRTADPNSKTQGLFAPSSEYMPPFMRLNPALYWSYGQVWHFLRLFHLPYCSLYDEGYTSLGTIHDTLPCPALARPQGGYWPAYMLSDWDQERAGRIPKKKKKKDNDDDVKRKLMTPAAATVSGDDASNESESTTSAATTETNVKVEGDTNQNHQVNGDNGDKLSEGDESSYRTDDDAAALQKTAGLIIIGDEILKGLTPDTNTQSAAVAFRLKNVLLSRVVVVADEMNEIVEEINRMRKEVAVIVTSGGVGPTHDDVTMYSVGTALASELVIHEEMANFLLQKMGAQGNDDAKLSDAQIKMATLPRNSKLLYLAGKDQWPIVRCRNIYVLPGVPQFFQQQVELIASHLATDLEKVVSCKLVLSVEETKIVNALNQVVRDHPHATLGSYPFVEHPEFKTVVTIEAKEGPTFPGEGRCSVIKRRNSMLENLSTEDMAFPASPSEEGVTRGNSLNSSFDSCTQMGLFTREERDMHVKLAMDDLIRTLPEGSVLRLENNDGLC
mmetsp:Transcript_53225/g.62150  ORF Transcript_53225/g.62150 Transcript_53225/m.62150 type:complete len:787 (-) Transcript_53225:86-2446(-)